MEIDLWQDRGVPVTQDGPRTCPSPTCRRSLKTQIWNKKRASARRRDLGEAKKRAKSLTNKDFTSKSFKLKDFAGFFA